MTRYTNFLFKQHLVNKNEDQTSLPPDDTYLKAKEEHLKLIKEEKPQYLLKEKSDEEASFKDYANYPNEAEEMKQ